MFKHTPALLCGLLLAFASCQSPESETATTEQTTTETAASSEARQPRPKPEYFVIPAELSQKRVYICSDASEDTFHQKHDCPVLVTCTGTFRNLTLTRAIEDFDRYNCETCSADLAHIFDEESVRMETGLGK